MTFSRDFSPAFKRGPSPFTCDFDDDFDTSCDDPVTIAVIPLDLTQRPKHPPYSPLWRRYMFPLTPAAVLLWQSGAVLVVDSYDDSSLTADDIIYGGTQWFTPGDSWQAEVLEAAGFELIPYEGPVA